MQGSGWSGSDQHEPAQGKCLAVGAPHRAAAPRGAEGSPWASRPDGQLWLRVPCPAGGVAVAELPLDAWGRDRRAEMCSKAQLAGAGTGTQRLLVSLQTVCTRNKLTLLHMQTHAPAAAGSPGTPGRTSPWALRHAACQALPTPVLPASPGLHPSLRPQNHQHGPAWPSAPQGDPAWPEPARGAALPPHLPCCHPRAIPELLPCTEWDLPGSGTTLCCGDASPRRLLLQSKGTPHCPQAWRSPRGF